MVSLGVLTGLALALGSGAGWSGLDAVRKRLTAELSPEAILLGIAAVQVPMHGALLAWTGLPEVQPGFFAWVALAAVVVAASNWLLTRAVQIAPLSGTVPLLSFTPVFAAGTSAWILGEVPGRAGGAGLVAAVLGAMLLNTPARAAWRAPLRALVREPGARLTLLVAFLFALASTLDRRASLLASEPAYAFATTSAVTLGLAAVPRIRRELLAHPRAFLGILFAAVCMAAALLLQLYAFRYLPVAYVETAKRAATNLLSVGLGALLFGEREGTRRRLFAALLMTLGVGLVLLDA